MAQEKSPTKSDDAHPRDEDGRFTQKDDAPKSTGRVKAKDSDSKSAGSKSKSSGGSKGSSRGGADQRKSR